MPDAAETLNDHRLTDADIAAALTLSDAAGWNQTPEDWALFCRHGVTRGRATADRTIVATAATLPYEDRYAWVSMVLVAQQWRQRGIARALLTRAVNDLEAAGRVALLDATDAGAPLYRSMGFTPGYPIVRWEGRCDSVPAPPDADPETAGIRPATLTDAATLVRLDEQAGGPSRGFLLRDLLARPGTRAWALSGGGSAAGFVVVRAGRRAHHVGPLVAPGAPEAAALLDVALASLAGPVYLDVPQIHEDLAANFSARGFRPQRSLLRMARGDAVPGWALQTPAALFAIAGPEYG